MKTVHLPDSYFIKEAVAKSESLPQVETRLFADFPLHKNILKNLDAIGFARTTVVQDKSIEHVLAGSDVIGIANTGTGKTAAFLLPLLNEILKGKRRRALIVVPTRELALQINQEFLRFSRGLGVRSAVCIGGAGMGAQMKSLASQPQFVIGTPGRLKDFSRQKRINYTLFDTVVLDEVDRMLDMGFIHDIRFLISLMPESRQSLFFSATLPTEIAALADSFLKTPVKIEVRTAQTSQNVKQDVVRLRPGEDKVERLHEILIEPEMCKVIIFGRTKFGVDKLVQKLKVKGFRVDAIHGNKSQGSRQRVLAGFREGKINILVATDVAARGLDIPDVSHVINFDLPHVYEDYIHRIGRTGRGDKVGAALTFIG